LPKPATVPAPQPANSNAGSGDGSRLPGASGGAKMNPGTPSAGGTVGKPTGVHFAGAARPPEYPEEARARGLEGRPIVWLRISKEGRVVEVKLQQSCGHRILDAAALRWAWTLRFLPARRGNTPVEATVLKPVKFYLE